MTFIETPRFPDDLSYGSRGGARYNTTVVNLASGHESRNQNWTASRHVYDAAFSIKDQSDLDELIEYFHAMGGRLHAFRFKDFLDYKSVGVQSTVTNLDQTIGTGDTSETNFQLIKTYTKGALSTVRDITKPVNGTVLIALDGTPQTETTHYTIDYSTGIVTFVSPPGNSVVVTAGYEFDVPCRFGEDTLDISLDAFETGNASVLIVEIRI